MEAFTALSGRSPAVVHWFERWDRQDPFDPVLVARCWDMGAAPMISWEPWQGLERITSGVHDVYLADYAGAAAAHGQPVFLRFAHEMNLPPIPWHAPPGVFLAAWERVRGFFHEAGASNVRFVWSPYVDGRGIARLSPYFPGRDKVEWLGLDGYNWGRRGWWQRAAGFDRLFGPSLRALEGLMPDAPVMLAEIGCAQFGAKAAWMREALLDAVPNRYPQVRAVVWFNEHRREHADWRVDSSPEALTAWREIGRDPRYGLEGEEVVRIGG